MRAHAYVGIRLPAAAPWRGRISTQGRRSEHAAQEGPAAHRRELEGPSESVPVQDCHCRGRPICRLAAVRGVQYSRLVLQYGDVCIYTCNLSLLTAQSTEQAQRQQCNSRRDATMSVCMMTDTSCRDACTTSKRPDCARNTVLDLECLRLQDLATAVPHVEVQTCTLQSIGRGRHRQGASAGRLRQTLMCSSLSVQ